MAFSNRKLLLASVCMATLTGTAAMAAAQDRQVADASASAEGPALLDEIVVTARRKVEAIQDVPVAVTALSGAQMEEKGLRSTEDLRNFAPGVNISGQRRDEAQFYIRGQGPGVISTGQRNFTSVATYFAEVPTTMAGPGVFYDLASVQVLKGPQGTLFGRNTTGGAILFEPATPTDDTEGTVKLTYGNYDYREAEGMVNVALVPEKVAFRLAGQVSRRDGYTTSVNSGQKLDGREYEAVRASLRVSPVDELENTTIFDYRTKDNSGGSAILRGVMPGAPLGATATPAALAPLLGLPAGSSVNIPLRAGGVVSIGCLSAALPGCPTGPFGNAVAAFQAAYNRGNMADAANSGFALVAPTPQLLAILAQQQALGVRKSLSPSPLRSKGLDLGITNRTTYIANDYVTFKNVVAFRKSRRNEAADYDGTPLSFLANDYVTDQEWGTGSEQFTEEFQLQGQLPSQDLSYIFGFYHEHTKPGFLQEVPGVTLGNYSKRLSDNRDISDAVFGHLEWNPTDYLGLSGGVRKTWDSREASLSVLNQAGTCTQTLPGTTIPQCPIAYSANFDALTYDFTVNVRPATDVLLYGGYRRGYKSGGINLPAPEQFRSFDPETVDSFEVGLKADWDIGVPLRTNAAAFYDKYDNIQVQQSVQYTAQDGTQIATSLVRNSVKATNKGFEFEATIVPSSMLNLSGFASYLSAHATNGIPGVVIEGRQFPNQPKWKYGISGNLFLPVPDAYGDVTLSADWSWQDQVNTDQTPGIIATNPSYGLLNARIEWANVLGHGFDLSVYGTNLTDKTYVLGGYPITALGFNSAVYGEPRMYGMSLRVHF